MRTPLPFGNGFYKSDSAPLSAQVCINFYPEPLEVEGLSTYSVRGTPGLVQEATTGSTTEDSNRGGHVMSDKAYFVNGTTLYRIGNAGDQENLGTIAAGERVVCADNGTQMVVLVPNETAYVYTVLDGLTEITDEGFTENGVPVFVAYVDGYFVFITDQKKFISSALNDGLSYDSTDVGTAESDPDALTGAVVLNNQLYLIGTETTEQHANRPRGADFPFQRTGNFADFGSRSRYSIVEIGGRAYFVGGSKNETSVLEYTGSGQPQKISTRPIDNILQDLTQPQIANIVGWAYSQGGHYFVGFNLGNTTIVFDISTGLWHERRSTVTYANEIAGTARCRMNTVLQAYGKVLAADAFDGRIGRLDLDVFDEYGENMIRRCVGQPLQNQGASLSVPMLEVTMESGMGNDDVTDPQVRMERSLDGKTWKDARDRDIGQIGEYDKRQIWYRNGRASRFEYFAFEMSAKCKAVIMQVIGDVVSGYK